MVWREDDTIRFYLLPGKRGVGELSISNIGGVAFTIVSCNIGKVLIEL